MQAVTTNKYKVSLLLSILVLFLTFSSQLFASSKMTIIVEGKEVLFTADKGYPFVDSNYRTQVPLRSVAEASGAKVEWDAVRRTAIVKKNGITLEIPINVPKIYKNGYPIYNDTAAILSNGRTYLPIRKVLEHLNYDVMYMDNPPTIRAFKIDDKVTNTKADGLPAKYDLRVTGKLGAIRDQLQTNDCWAFASSAVLQSKLLPGENLVFSPKHLREHSNAALVYPEGGGSQDVAASYYLNWLGPVKESEDPFDQMNIKEALKPAKHIMGYIRIDDKNYNAIKKAIMEHGAVYSAIFGESDTNEDNMINYDTSSQNYTGFKDQNHAIAIVGWDDNYPKENFFVKPKNNGAFIVMNSYGTDWGDKGFYYVSYEDLHIGTYAVYYHDIQSSDNYDNLYTTDDYGATGWLTYYVNNAQFGNAYTPLGMEVPEAIGIYNLNSNMSVEIYMLPNFVNINSFKTIKAQLVGKANLVGRGYHTVKLNGAPAINSKAAFIVQATTTDEALKIPIEQPYRNQAEIFNTFDGEGYFGQHWEMLDAEEYSGSNITMKLYTRTVK